MTKYDPTEIKSKSQNQRENCQAGRDRELYQGRCKYFYSVGDGFLYQKFLSFSKFHLSKCRNQDCYRPCSGFDLENKTQKRIKSQRLRERNSKVDTNGRWKQY